MTDSDARAAFVLLNIEFIIQRPTEFENQECQPIRIDRLTVDYKFKNVT